jgi:hypothetical protein
MRLVKPRTLNSERFRDQAFSIERPTFNAHANAGGGARTHTILRSLDFESSASASSATPAAGMETNERRWNLKRFSSHGCCLSGETKLRGVQGVSGKLPETTASPRDESVRPADWQPLLPRSLRLEIAGATPAPVTASSAAVQKSPVR